MMIFVIYKIGITSFKLFSSPSSFYYRVIYLLIVHIVALNDNIYIKSALNYEWDHDISFEELLVY